MNEPCAPRGQGRSLRCRPVATSVLVPLAMAASLFAGTVAPGPARAQAPLTTYWPNDDGTAWRFRQTFEQTEWAGGVLQVDNEVRFELDGWTSVPDGIPVQRLTLDVVGSGRFHQLLLRDAHFRKTENEISAYRPGVVNQRAWTWLVADLRPGRSFELQLLPDQTDDVWLRGTVTGLADVDVPAGTFRNCLRVEYRLDLGRVPCGEGSGAVRAEVRGHVLYAPGIGPVYSEEIWLPAAELLDGVCPELADRLGEIGSSGSLALLDAVITPIRTESWGRLKGRYRAESSDRERP